MGVYLSSFDYAIIAFYFVVVFIVAQRVSEKQSSDDYFLAGRNLGWFAIGASLFASNIGSEHLIGLAGAGARGGVAVAQFEILAGIILLVLGWVFVPFYLRSGVTTMPEFLERRYGRSARNYLSFISVVAYVLTKISATIFAGAVVFESIGVSFWLGAAITVISTGLYTAVGGLKAVIYTDVFQVFIMITGSIFVTFLGIKALGGVEQFRLNIEPEFLSLWKSVHHPEFPWSGILFGAPILGVWYWCTDQFIVQRVLCAKNLTQARKGTIFAGYLKMLPLFLFVIPGMIAYALSQKGLLNLENSDHALPALISLVLPSGLKGLVVAGLLAALMSSLSSVFNSCSTLITYDWYRIKKPQASQKQLLQVGRVSTVVLVVLGLLWIPLMKYVAGGLFTYIQSVQAYISPPIAAVFLFGLFIKRLNLTGAMASLGVGFILGLLRLVLEVNHSKLSGLWLMFATMNFLHFAIFLFIICSCVLIITSFFTPAPLKEDIKDVVFQRRTQPLDASSWRDLWVDRSLSIGLVGVIVFFWIYFI